MLKKSFFSGIASGLMIAIGAGVLLSCDSKYVGAIAFSVALIVICMLGLYLYTGKIGLLLEDLRLKNIAVLVLGLLGNYIGATSFAYLIGQVKPQLAEKAYSMCQIKLDLPVLSVIFLGIMCGVLMYTAVKSYALTRSPVVLIFCVSVFILSGYEHSIADMAYFAVAGVFSLKYIAFISLVVLGNTIGALIIPILIKLGGTEEKVVESK